MTKTLLPALALIAIAVASCSTTKLDTKELMIGKWTTEKVRVKIISMNNTDADSTIIVSSEDFKQELGIYSNVGHYNADGTYEDVYYLDKDSVLMRTTGEWMMQGTDSIIVRQDEPTQREHRYFVKLKKDKGIFKGLVDWDGDGKQDDEFTGIATRADGKK